MQPMSFVNILRGYTSSGVMVFTDYIRSTVYMMKSQFMTTFNMTDKFPVHDEKYPKDRKIAYPARPG